MAMMVAPAPDGRHAIPAVPRHRHDVRGAVPFDQFRLLTRIHYQSARDDTWGEDEIDYMLFIKAPVKLHLNDNEVQATQYVSASTLKEMVQDPSFSFTPWFKLICGSILFDWWEKLDSSMTENGREEDIRRM
ncbi:hypothetical protein XA68_13698 [Ophiocordyceps unilateralis]|uniref:Uncharacterized protein n=1 Tax=Ophiocordyceps unilateralis TaxID=268505 RepID=A0A2A9PBX5_OPHUN|nr:hypothetical protein XA68_13698 [Ophiocordyceps unilateralis]